MLCRLVVSSFAWQLLPIYTHANWFFIMTSFMSFSVCINSPTHAQQSPFNPEQLSAIKERANLKILKIAQPQVVSLCIWVKYTVWCMLDRHFAISVGLPNSSCAHCSMRAVRTERWTLWTLSTRRTWWMMPGGCFSWRRPLATLTTPSVNLEQVENL